MTDTTNPELTLTRVFSAPRDLVWKAWTDPAMLAKWWGPQGFTNPISIVLHIRQPDHGWHGVHHPRIEFCIFQLLDQQLQDVVSRVSREILQDQPTNAPVEFSVRGGIENRRPIIFDSIPKQV